MNTEEYLKQGIKITHALAGLIKEKERLTELSTSTGGFKYSNEPSNSNKPQSAKFENYSVSKVDLLNEVEKDILQYWQMHSEIRNTIKQVEDLDIQTALRMRYLVDMTIEEIAKHYHVSRKTIERRLNKGHIEVSKITGYPTHSGDPHAIAKNMLEEIYSDGKNKK